jgi:hypothetical protein
VRRRDLSPTTKLVANLALAAAVLVSAIVLVTHRRDNTREQEEADRATRLERLRSLPYTFVTSYAADTSQAGVRIFDRAGAYPGYNLYCSRTDPEAYLMDMEGTVVHTWSQPGAKTWVWEHAVMQPDGDIVVIDKFKDLLRLAWDGEVVGRLDLDVHHDVAFLPDGSCYAIIRGAEVHRGLIVEFPVIVHVSPGGEELNRWYAYDHLDEIKQKFDQRSFLDTVLDSMAGAGGEMPVTEPVAGRIEVNTLSDGRVLYDYFHLNTLTILPETPLGNGIPASGPAIFSSASGT